jgi:NAD(P)-dependent dehydrogenase (short-subunit alcohol dehydrogenase family)
MAGRLQNKVVLITGTGGGQGREAALMFAAEGARVVGCDVKQESRETVALVEAAGGAMTSSEPVDLTDPDQVKQWIDDAAGRHGGFDVLYNNAASARFAPIANMSLEDWHFTIRSELDIVFYASKFAWPHLVKRGSGVIINTASVAGMVGSMDTGTSAHSAAKAGVIALTRQAAVEGAEVGIRVAAICPGPIWTPGLEDHLGAYPDVAARIADTTLLRRWGKPGEIAALAVYLASDEASFVTGVAWPVDGGLTAR